MSTQKPNVVILLTDDQRWDKVTPQYMPNVAGLAGATKFDNTFGPNPVCCPSRATILSGQFAHTTQVWKNHPPLGGFAWFDDSDTIATDFRAAGYRTAMIGKYLNGYRSGIDTYVPPGWSRWFSVDTGAFYDYGATTKNGVKTYGAAESDYVTNVLRREAIDFITGTGPFFLYLSFTAPHGPAIPDPRDVGRFAGHSDYTYDANGYPSSALESAYGADRAIGAIVKALPANTIILFLSDNGYLWHDDSPRGVMDGKVWPYNESIRIPMTLKLPAGAPALRAGASDIVSNVDVRPSLTHAAGVPLPTPCEGADWFGSFHRDDLLLEHYGARTYAGVRLLDWMYVRIKEDDGSYTEELYDENADPLEMSNLAGDPNHASRLAALRSLAQQRCSPLPPEYSW